MKTIKLFEQFNDSDKIDPEIVSDCLKRRSNELMQEYAEHRGTYHDSITSGLCMLQVLLRYKTDPGRSITLQTMFDIIDKLEKFDSDFKAGPIKDELRNEIQNIWSVKFA